MITFLRALCAKAKEVANLCDAHLEREAKKSKQTAPPADSSLAANRMIPIAKWNDYHDWPTPGRFRWMLYMTHKTGADYFVRRAGRRIVICEKSFFEWVNMNEEERVKASPVASRFREKCKLR